MRSFILASATAATLVSSVGFGVIANAQPSSGSYQNTCQHPTIVNGMLTAECTDINHQLHVSSLPYLQCQGDISNQNGVLSCNRVAANTGTAAAPNNYGQRDNIPQAGNRGDNFNNGNNANNQRYYDNQYNNGRVQGGNNSQVGGRRDNFGNGNNADNQRNYDNQYNSGRGQGGDQNSNGLYARGYAYPTYGDQRYGDPRYDPRYAQGGYAYGRQANQWMPIAQRGQWLEQRIARGQQEGTVDSREARGLRQELVNLRSLEVRYRRQGLQPRMIADLDRRFDLLAARIQYERTDGDHPGVAYRR
jgi:hypothetical protein